MLSEERKVYYKKFLMIAVPIMIQNGITNFVGMLDNVMVGRVGTDPMSGVAIVNQLLFVWNLSIFGGMSGIGIFAAQFFGKGDHDGIRYSFRLGMIAAAVLSAAGILLMPGLPIGSAVFLAGAIAAFLCINRSRPFAPDMPRRPFPFTLLLPDVILILALVFLKALGLSSQAGWAAVFSPILLFWTLRLQRGLSRHIFPVFPVLCALLLLTAMLTGTSPVMVLYALFAGTLTGLVLYLLLPSLSFSDWAPFVTQDMVRDLCAQVRDFLHEHIRDFTSRLPFRHKEEKTEDQEEEDTVEEKNNDEAGQ